MSFFRNRQDSKDIAKKRLKNLISYEKNNMTVEKLDMIKSEVLNTVEDYFYVNRINSDVYITEEDGEPAIVVIVPIAKDSR